jgi:hypothetical protein
MRRKNCIYIIPKKMVFFAIKNELEEMGQNDLMMECHVGFFVDLVMKM